MTEEKKQTERPMMMDILMDGPPSAEGPRFIEVEALDGKGLGVGEWVEKKDGLWALRLKVMVPIKKGKIWEGPQHDEDYEGDLVVWMIKVSPDQRIWVTAEERSGALAVAESMDYFDWSSGYEDVSIRMALPGEVLEVWMCHNDPELIPELLKPYIIEPEENSEFDFITIGAPCAIWAQSMKGRADLLADSEAYC